MANSHPFTVTRSHLVAVVVAGREWYSAYRVMDVLTQSGGPTPCSLLVLLHFMSTGDDRSGEDQFAVDFN